MKPFSKIVTFFLFFLTTVSYNYAQQRVRDYGIQIGVIPTGKHNAIIDVKGVKVGHVTIEKEDSVHTGVTAILPHGGNIFQEKVPAAIFVGNGFGKLAGSTQIEELGTIETPIILTNTLNVGTAVEAVVKYTLQQKDNENVRSVNAVVGETNDGYLNDIRGMHVTHNEVLEAIETASEANTAEGSIGAGTGTICFGYKGGIGTSSRKLPGNLGGYTIGVMVQTNFGGVLQIAGINIGKKLGNFSFSNQFLNNVDGSCMVVVATDAPLTDRNLKRLAKRAFMGLAKTGGIASNGSGDYIIAFSTSKQVRVPYKSISLLKQEVVSNDYMSPLFMAAIEATEEAILNSLFMGKTTTGKDGRIIKALPVPKVISILKAHKLIEE
ncbi:P1 family peptidase [Galbibacter pacificus]|uniref:P1 family peptidase n=1 Tax=Galbibacter pacificus TaxID=2996052 RepID=A0ABT6FU45_9FLAO|nr:P1 family peptidase [Galbibacter pacificus]MDG3583302.1 P1 family peptidase [Galbibacter pacificus]MDG3586783.1 P1 family peptidase [Galbibacter pacificus]